jgi:hypothetical protein
MSYLFVKVYYVKGLLMGKKVLAPLVLSSGLFLGACAESADPSQYASAVRATEQFADEQAIPAVCTDAVRTQKGELNHESTAGEACGSLNLQILQELGRLISQEFEQADKVNENFLERNPIISGAAIAGAAILAYTVANSALKRL